MVHKVKDVPSWEFESVESDATLISAIEIMFENDYSQLGIRKDGEVIGMISFRSISRILTILKNMDVEKNLPGRSVRIAMEDTDPKASPDDNVVELFDILAEDRYVLVDSPQSEQLEILTTYDLLHHLRDLIKSFLLIEDIEKSVRRMIKNAFNEDLDVELQEFFDDMDIRTPQTISDCSFGHYPEFVRQNWERFGEHFEENGDFVGKLIKEVGEVRNKVFHFRTDPGELEIDAELLTFAHGYFLDRVPESPAD